MRVSQNMIAMAACVGAFLLALLVSFLAALGIENRSNAAGASALMGEGVT